MICPVSGLNVTEDAREMINIRRGQEIVVNAAGNVGGVVGRAYRGRCLHSPTE